MQLFKRILAYLWPEVRKHKLSFFFVFLSYGIAIVFDSILKPYVYKEVVDSISSRGDPNEILSRVTFLAIIFVGIITVYFIFYRAGDYANAYFESKVMKGLYDKAFDKLLLHSYTFFSNTFSGSIVARVKRFSRSFEVLQDVLSFQIWFSFVSITGILVVLFFNLPVFGFIFLGWALVYIFITFLFLRKKVKLDMQKATADSLVTALLSHSITNILNIKIFSGNNREKNKFYASTLDEEKKRLKAWFYGNFQNLVQGGLMAILQVVVLFFTIRLWYVGKMSVGDFILLQSYMVGLFNILWSLGRSITKGMEAVSDMKEVVEMLDKNPDILDPVSPEKCIIYKGKIEFQNVNFEYIKNFDIFKNLNLEIKSGEKVGLVGRSGSGKSTITKMLLRFADVKEGKILIDGQDISKLKQEDLRNKISYVPQDPILFHRSIKENILYSKPEASEDEIIKSAQKARAHEFIMGLPEKYDTLVGERGVKLSGGERQRIAIARAMLKDAPILILDEATSSLDSISEESIQEAFSELMKGKTTIVIAHRLSTIQKMDRIILLDKGSIVEDGSHKELLEKNGYYADLWNRQTSKSVLRD